MARAYRAFVETDAMLVEINPLIVTPEGELRALDSKYTVDDNALFKHPDIAAMRDLDALDEQERMARERGVTYVKLDGTVGILGNGAGPRHVDARRRRAAPAARRPTSSTSAAAPRPTRSSPRSRCSCPTQGAGGALQRLRRHHPLRRGRPGHPDRARAARRRACRSSSGSTARTTSRAGELLADAAPPNVYVEQTMLGAAERVVELAGSGRWWPSWSTADTRLVVQGITGREGSFHAARNRDYGTRSSPASRRARAARRSTASRCSTRSPTPSPSEGANTAMVFVPPRFAADAIYEAADAGVRDGRLHHRGHPRPRHAAALPVRARPRRDAARAQLPGRALARPRERRHHPGAGVQTRPDRARLALGHAHVPDRQGAGPRRPRQLDHRRHRRRPDRRARRSSTSSSGSRPTRTPTSS